MGRRPADAPPSPPYLPYKTFNTFLDNLRAGMPNRIDRSVMRSLAGGVQSAIIATLRYMNLIDSDGIPSDRLIRLVNSQGAEHEKVLRETLHTAYPFLFKDGFNLHKATPQELQEKFQEVGIAGDTIRKSMAFFISAAQDAKIDLSPHIGKIQRGPRQARQKPKRNGADEGKIATPPVKPIGEENMGWHHLLLAKFPSFDPAWPAEVQAKWFDSFERLMERTEGK